MTNFKKIAATTIAALSAVTLLGPAPEAKANIYNSPLVRDAMQNMYGYSAPAQSQRPLTLGELQHFCSGYSGPGYVYKNGSCWKNGGGSVVNKDFARRWLTNQGY